MVMVATVVVVAVVMVAAVVAVLMMATVARSHLPPTPRLLLVACTSWQKYQE